MRMRRVALPLVLVALMAIPADAADQLDARDAPETTGPLEAGEKGCDGGTEKHEGEVVARVRLCYRLFLVNVEEEDDEERDFGAIWLQSTVDAKRGWCTTAVRTSALVSSDGTIHARTPSRRITAKRARSVTRGLKIDAQGALADAAKISQDFIVYPKRTVPSLNALGDGERFKLTWKGSTARPLGFAMGAELSWAQADGSPQIDPKLTYDFSAKPNGCR
ncbi:MAG: hypothetical protein ACRDLB_02815 [Actinomycetota bacterium]